MFDGYHSYALLCFSHRINLTSHSFRDKRYWHIQLGSTRVEASFISLGPQHTPRERIMDKRSVSRNQSDRAFEKSLRGLVTCTYITYYPSQGGNILHFHIDQVVMHPSFQPPNRIRNAYVLCRNYNVHLMFTYTDNLLNDIALIKVRSQIPIDGTFIDIANLPPAGSGNNIPEAGSVNYVVGWGCMQVGGNVVNRAQMIELRTNTQRKCVNAFGYDLINDVTRFCAGYFQRNRGVCPGDSGSGLISFQNQTPMVVGVVSAGYKQRAASMPAKFTRVAPFVSWIRQYVG
ncbi:hypothetical protein EG68_05621 [Paragonimus skrjabini miyazakii]|uniref:Peptidase S1 domain-containing protein n=1 Tax=Paragonimus skrjabini miyazakii TaxID=59628 RepID=A0A8S9YQH3_9TREM|nr:hypothetical protein EG68_05621 [Paragonimus skrjabini miyazakii]